MNELEKLKKLLRHWKKHNEEHAETYREWAEKASSLGSGDLSEILTRLSQGTRELTGLFEEAERKAGRL